eukprot:12310853-Alexandrium_andersonii.AAC.1
MSTTGLQRGCRQARDDDQAHAACSVVPREGARCQVGLRSVEEDDGAMRVQDHLPKAGQQHSNIVRRASDPALNPPVAGTRARACLLYTSDAADDM